MKKFKKNYHKAKRYSLKKINLLIDNYPKCYNTPKYLTFMKEMASNGWDVKMYIAKVSKYVFVSKGDEIYKIRFSNHKPYIEREENNDCDFYAGRSNYQVSTTEEILKRILNK